MASLLQAVLDDYGRQRLPALSDIGLAAWHWEMMGAHPTPPYILLAAFTNLMYSAALLQAVDCLLQLLKCSRVCLGLAGLQLPAVEQLLQLLPKARHVILSAECSAAAAGRSGPLVTRQELGGALSGALMLVPGTASRQVPVGNSKGGGSGSSSNHGWAWFRRGVMTVKDGSDRQLCQAHSWMDAVVKETSVNSVAWQILQHGAGVLFGEDTEPIDGAGRQPSNSHPAGGMVRSSNAATFNHLTAAGASMQLQAARCEGSDQGEEPPDPSIVWCSRCMLQPAQDPWQFVRALLVC